MRREMPSVMRLERGCRKLSRKANGHGLHHRHQPEPSEAALKVGRADEAVLDPMTERDRAGGLDRVTHGGNCSITDRMRRHLKPCLRCDGNELAELGQI